MGTNNELSSLQLVIDAYRSKLDTFPESRFTRCPPIGGWSASEVYSHIFDASLLSLKAMEECLEGRGSYYPTPWITKVILFMGAFPPGMKFKVPKVLEGRTKVISKTVALDMMQQFVQELEIQRVKLTEADPKVKTKHPRLGYLNAAQWLRFIGIHLKHHLKQLKRVEMSF